MAFGFFFASVISLVINLRFSDDNNYFKNALLENSNLDLFGDLPKCEVVLPNGEDKTEFIEKRVAWLKEHPF